MALCVRFDDPMNAVEYPESLSNNHAFACNLVVLVSYETLTSAPIDASQSSARRSVDPVYTVVITTIHRFQSGEYGGRGGE
jgi:hypothetical protein